MTVHFGGKHYIVFQDGHGKTVEDIHWQEKTKIAETAMLTMKREGLLTTGTVINMPAGVAEAIEAQKSEADIAAEFDRFANTPGAPPSVFIAFTFEGERDDYTPVIDFFRKHLGRLGVQATAVHLYRAALDELSASPSLIIRLLAKIKTMELPLPESAKLMLPEWSGIYGVFRASSLQEEPVGMLEFSGLLPDVFLKAEDKP